MIAARNAWQAPGEYAVSPTRRAFGGVAALGMGSLILGEYERAGRRLPLSLRVDDRRQHIYAIGQTGTGKTTLLTSLITQDIALGRGCALLDPHGDVAEALLDRIPRNRTDDTIYFNPADPQHVAGPQPP